MEQNIIESITKQFTYRRSDKYLKELYSRLKNLENKLDEFLTKSDADLSEIEAVTGYINNLKKEISFLESERKKQEERDKPQVSVQYDNQSILSTSSVRRKVNADLVKSVPIVVD